MNYPSPYCTPQHPGSREGANTPQFASYNNDHINYQPNVKQQSPHSFAAHLQARNSPAQTKTPPASKECNDVATKSLSGLESLVDQIPTDSDRLTAGGGAGPTDYVKSETLTDSVLNQYQPPAGSEYNSFNTPYSANSSYPATHYSLAATAAAASYNMSSPFSMNNLLTSNSYGAPPPGAGGGGQPGPNQGQMNHQYGKPPGPPPPPHHLGPANLYAMAEPPHMPVPMFPYTQQNPYPTYPAATPHPSLLQPSYPYSPYSNPGFSSHHMFDRF